MTEQRDKKPPETGVVLEQLESVPAAVLATHLGKLAAAWPADEHLFVAARNELDQWIECRRALNELFDGSDPDEWIERAFATFPERTPWCARMILSAAETAETEGLLVLEAVLLQLWIEQAVPETENHDPEATLRGLEEMHPAEAAKVSGWYSRYADFILAEWGDAGSEYVQMVEAIYRTVAARNSESLTPLGRAFLEGPPESGEVGVWLQSVQGIEQ